MTKKILALVLVLLLILPVIFTAGCSKSGGEKKTDETNTATVDKKDEYDVPVRNLGGHEFRFVVGDTTQNMHLAVNEVYAEELNGNKINDAVYRRNMLLEETYKCTISEDRLKDVAEAIREQLIAGEYQYDYIYYGVKWLRPLSAAGLLTDFKELENIDLSKSWWDQNAIEGLAISGKVFYLTGDAGTLDERSSWIVYFNKDIVEMAGIGDLYQLARDGKWTIDKMYEYMVATKEDLDGDGVMTIGKDRFGYIGEDTNNWYHLAACNVKLSRITENGVIEIPPTVNEDVINAWNALKPLLTSEYREVSDEGPRFRQNLATFFSCNEGAILNMNQNSAFRFGILPMPKLNEGQKEYWTSISGGWCYGYAIPTVVDQGIDWETNGFSSGREQAAYFLEAYAFHSVDTLKVAFFDQVVKLQTVQDEASAEMLELATRNKVYDPVVIFDFGGIGTTLFRNVGSNGGRTAGKGTAVPGSDVNYDTLVSTYQSRVTAARKALNNYINYITNDD